MKGLVTALVLLEELFTLLQDFVCKVYASQASFCKVIDMRYKVLRVKKGDVDSSQISPCKDTLMVHAMRANYQACRWERMFRTRKGHHLKLRGTWMDDTRWDR